MPGGFVDLSFPGASQKLQCVDHAVAVFPLKTQHLAELGADHDHDLVETILTQLRQAEVATRFLAEMELNAHVFQ